MKFIQGLRTLVTDSRYNYSFILSLIATVIISVWLLLLGSLNPDFNDPIQGVGISIVVSFQYFMITLVIISLISRGRDFFFGEQNRFRNQFALSIIFIAVFMVLGWLSYAAGPIVGAALTFCDAIITAYFTVLLGWNISKSVSQKAGESAKMQWTIFLVFAILNFMMFGAAFMFLGLAALPIEQMIVLLMFPLGILLLPILTIVLRNKEIGPDQTSILTLILFAFGLYYTYRLISITGTEWVLSDITIQMILLVYGLASTVAKVNESINVKPTMAITLVLFVILSRVGSYINRLLAESTMWGPIVQVGITSFTILNLAVLGFIVPLYWMWMKKKNVESESTE